jgi:hypothetical protein
MEPFYDKMEIVHLCLCLTDEVEIMNMPIGL